MLKILLSVLLTFTSAFSLLKAQIDPMKPLEDGLRVKYGKGPCEYYDMYLPESVGTEADVVFVVHGGSWMGGDQTMFTDHAQYAAQKGYVGVTADYDKILNNISGAEMAQELYDAVSSVRDTLAEQGITARRLVVGGHSSGSHLALLYAFTHAQDSPIPIAFTVGVSSPAEPYKDFGGDTMIERGRDLLLTALTKENINARTAEKYQAAIDAVTPVAVANENCAPVLLLHGTEDNVVPTGNSEDLYARLRELGVPTELVLLEGQGHFFGRDYSAVYPHVEEWAERYLK